MAVRALRWLTVGALSGAVVAGGPAVAAQAKPLHTVTLAQAAAALPHPSLAVLQWKAGPRLQHKAAAYVMPCDDEVKLAATGSATASYAGPSGAAGSATQDVTTVVFASAAKATAALAKVKAIERTCAKVRHTTESAITVTRSVSRAYAPAGWAGVLTVDDNQFAEVKTTVGQVDIFLARGNVLVHVLGGSSDRLATLAKQQTWARQAATDVIVKLNAVLT